MPAKKAQQTIVEALESISQSFSNESDFEVVVVLHGMEDPTFPIVDHYSKNHPNIRVMISGNPGVAHSRNVGLCEARGEFIGFLDADDLLFFNGVDFYKSLVQSHSSPLFFGQPYQTGHEQSLMNQELILGNKNLDAFFASSVLVSALWQYYIRRNFLVDKAITFDERLLRDEDGHFCAQLITHSPSVFVSGKHFIVYRDSASGLSKRFTERHIIAMAESYSGMYEILNDAGFSKSIVRWSDNYVDIYLFIVAFSLSRGQRRHMANLLLRSKCHKFLKTCDRTKPRILYELLGYRLGWTIVRLTRKKQWERLNGVKPAV